MHNEICGEGWEGITTDDGWKGIPEGDGISRDGITKPKPGI